VIATVAGGVLEMSSTWNGAEDCPVRIVTLDGKETEPSLGVPVSVTVVSVAAGALIETRPVEHPRITIVLGLRDRLATHGGLPAGAAEMSTSATAAAPSAGISLFAIDPGCIERG